ncbi:hypothetical protein [Streptosporangium vulgare]|uniref:Minor tail protein n=1 Tax=Streptosporangium vulgare TaxID=46190 RepID=A0ABV5TRB7_9ACTN
MAYWSTITVEVPVGNGAGDLTSDFNKIKPKGEHGTRSGTRSSVNVQPGPQGSNAFQATAPGGRTPFAPGDYMVLTLENVTVAPTAGLAVLTVTENTSRTKTARLSTSFAAVALVKTAPKELPAPRDFHPDKAMVDAGEKLTLRWEQSAGFRYEITYPGAPQPVPVSRGSWSPPDAPKRATTYILIATNPNTQQQHFLTTTVQVRNPVLDTLTATTGIDTPWVGGPNSGDGAVAFSPGGATVRRARGSNDLGTLHAGEATVSGVATGGVIADRITVNQVNTERVQGKANTGGLTFNTYGVEVSTNSGSQGTVLADSIAVNRVNAARVQGKSTTDGWISFPESGIQVSHGAYNDPPRIGAVYAEAGIYRSQSFTKGETNAWLTLSDGGGVSLEQRHEDGTTTYGVLRVSRIETDAARW